ncbi:MAG: HDOD domain-containing protein, partial [Phycisphaerae bacterium]
LTSKILSLVRRSDTGAGRGVTTVQQAVVLLGFTAVRNAVLSVKVYQTFASAPRDGSALDRSEFWKHSLAVACTAQLIAERVKGKASPGDAFVCGLLHDLGKVALDACLPKSYARVVRQTQARRACICDVERSVLGLDHTTAGKWLAKRWKLPQSVIDCVWLHHHPPENLPKSVASADLIGVVHLADDVVRSQGIGYSGYHPPGNPEALGKVLGLDAKALALIAASVGPALQQHSDLVGLGELTSAEVYAKALAGANQELGRLNVDLTETNRRLAVRSGCFEALARFHRALSADAELGDVCRAAACCTGSALGAEGAVVCFGLGSGGKVIHAACPQADEDEAVALALPDRVEAPRVSASERMGPPPKWVDPVLTRFGSALSAGPIWMLSAAYAGKMVGGMLWTSPNDAAARWADFPEELDALSGAIGLAMLGAVVRGESEARAEELADLNRRLAGAQQELWRSRSLNMIAAMAAGAAHELNNPLAVISGRAQMLAGELPEAKQQQSLQTVQDHANKASAIVSELLEFAKPDPPEPETVNLLPWLKQLRERWLDESSLSPGQIEIVADDPDIAVRADADQFVGILDAVVANALDAMVPKKAHLVINSACSASDESIVLSVTDNGIGMSPSVAEHALDPFFSHREAGRSRGLGLSRAHSLAASNGGRLWLESREGAGTTVFIELPATHAGKGPGA